MATVFVCGAPWSRTSTSSRSRPSTFLCRRWWTNRWRCSCLLTFLIPSGLLKFPRSRCLPALHADSRGYCRRRNSWCKCRWILSQGLGLLTRSLTFQLFVVLMELEVFKDFTQDRAIPLLRSRSLTIQFLVVVLVEVFMVYTQDRVLQRFMEQIIVSLQRLPSRTLTFQLRVVRRDDAFVMRQPTAALGRISCPVRSRGTHLESGALFPLSLYWQSLIRASRCCC